MQYFEQSSGGVSRWNGTGKEEEAMAHRHGEVRKGYGLKTAGIIVALMSLLAMPGFSQQNSPITAAVERTDVYLGESFIFQIQVADGSHARRPQLSSLDGFEVRRIPRRWINDDERRGSGESIENDYFYRIIALQLGRQTIPSITVYADGQSYSTRPIELSVRKPGPTEDYRLDVSLSKDTAYVGEPVQVEAIWYFRKNARFYSAYIPVLQRSEFSIADTAGSQGDMQIYLRTVGGAQNVSGTQGSATVDGVEYTTFTVRQAIIPNEPGAFDFLPATVQVWTREDDDDGPDWDDDSYVSTVVGSNELSMTVEPLPKQGQPSNFTGIVGEDLQVESSLSPTTMNVGDPVTLEVTISGLASVGSAQIPPLDTMDALSESFALYPDSTGVTVNDGRKTFSMTVRAKAEDVEEVPPVEVPYFDTDTGSYEIARSQPLAVTVKPTRVVTSEDLEGGEDTGGTKTSVHDSEPGIRYNYQGRDVLLQDQSLSASSIAAQPGVVALMGAPIIFLLGTGGFVMRDRLRRTRWARAMRSAPQQILTADDLRRRFAELDTEDPEAQLKAFAAWTEFLAHRLELKQESLTQEDVLRALRNRHIDDETLAVVRTLFRRYEHRKYASQIPYTAPTLEDPYDSMEEVADELERSMASYA
jgi:hypothetical protein